MVSGELDFNEFEIVDMPGAPPIYGHEMNPQVPIPVIEVFRAMGQIYTPEADGAIDASVTAFDGEMMGALKSWLGPLGQPVYAMAPLALPILEGGKTTDTPVVNFLDKMSAQFGERSLVYVSFQCCCPHRNPHNLHSCSILSPCSDLLRDDLFTFRAREVVGYDQHSHHHPNSVHLSSCLSAISYL